MGVAIFPVNDLVFKMRVDLPVLRRSSGHPSSRGGELIGVIVRLKWLILTVRIALVL